MRRLVDKLPKSEGLPERGLGHKAIPMQDGTRRGKIEPPRQNSKLNAGGGAVEILH